MHHPTKMKHHRSGSSLQPTIKQKLTTSQHSTPGYNNSTTTKASQSPPSHRQYPPPLNTLLLTFPRKPTNNHHSTHRPHSCRASVTPSPPHHQSLPSGTNQLISQPPLGVRNTSSPMTSPSSPTQYNSPPYVRFSNYHSRTTLMKWVRSHKHLTASGMSWITGTAKPLGMTPPSATTTTTGSLHSTKLTAHCKRNA